MYVQNTTVEALRLPYWRQVRQNLSGRHRHMSSKFAIASQITHNLEHYFLSGAPFMDPVFFPEDQQVCK